MLNRSLLILVVFGWLPLAGWAATFQVSNGNSIQAAIDQTVDGDTVRVGPGTYDESLYILKSIALVSDAGPYQTLITGGTNGSDFAYNSTRTILAMSSCTIDGFFITQPLREVDANHNSMAVLLEKTTDVVIRNCVIENHITGIYISGSSNTLIEDNIIQHCGNGVLFAAYAFDSDNNIIQNNAITLNGTAAETDDAGVKLISNYSGTGNDITSNDIYKNEQGINNLTSNTIMAQGNWWGNASGPQNSLNPNGNGNLVSNFVDFGDWATAEINDAVLQVADLPSSLEGYGAFPNPALEQITLQFDLTDRTSVRYTIVNVQGQTLIQQTAQLYNAGQHQVPISLDGLTTGLYLLHLETPNSTQLIRIAKQ